MLRCCAIVLGCVSSACSNPGLTPAEYARQSIDAPNLGPEIRDRIDRDTAHALAELQIGRFAEARRLARGIVALDPRAARARAIHGRGLVELARRTHPPELRFMEQAEGELLLARRTDPDDPVIHRLYAEFLEADGQLSLAAVVLDELLKAHPADLSALRSAARLRYELGEERLARILLARLLDRLPNDADAVYRLAHCQVRLAEAEAQENGDRRGAADPVAEAWLAAAATFRRYRDLRTDDVRGYLGEAHARFQALQSPRADPQAAPAPALAEILAVLDAGAKVAPDSPGPDHSRGVILEHREEPEQARAAYEQALAKDPRYLPSILNLARLHDALGQKEAAQAYCKRALGLDVTDAERRRLEAYLRPKAP